MGSDNLLLILSLVLATFSSWFLLVPFSREEKSDKCFLLEKKEILAQKKSLLNALDDLENTKLSNLVLESQYESSKNELMLDLAECIESLEKYQ